LSAFGENLGVKDIRVGASEKENNINDNIK
jgi:hypothetical protein